LPIVARSIDEPALGLATPRMTGGKSVDAVAYRVSIPELYNAGNDLTMRVLIHRTGEFVSDCFVVRLDARRLRDGSAIEPHGEAPLSRRA
jgi:hypothetical protein